MVSYKYGVGKVGVDGRDVTVVIVFEDVQVVEGHMRIQTFFFRSYDRSKFSIGRFDCLRCKE